MLLSRSCCTLFALLAACVHLACPATVPPWESEDASFWNTNAHDELDQALRAKKNENRAKNIILFVGDGMGMPTITAGRILKGQLKGNRGEDEKLAVDSFPCLGLAKSYATDSQTPDCAAPATALLSGIKTRAGLLGLDTNAIFSNCASATGREVKSIMDYALEEKKSVGIVTTSRITHATPGAAYANIPDNFWETDSEITDPLGGCIDISRQLVEENPDIHVLLGGGHRNFYPNNSTYPKSYRLDGKDLTQHWSDDKKNRSKSHAYVTTTGQLNNVDPSGTDYLFGLFSYSHMEYDIMRDKGPNGQPSLTEMTDKAIRILKRNPNGFFLLVESARIFNAHQNNKAVQALHEMVEFDKAIQKGLDMVEETDSLIVVTADHSMGFTLGGSPTRGNPIFGLVDKDTHILDDKPMTSLGYFNGPGMNVSSFMQNGRQNLTNFNTSDPNYEFQAAVPTKDGTRGGEDVVIYARGPMSHLFNGVHEQNYVYHVMAYAACLGKDKDKYCA